MAEPIVVTVKDETGTSSTKAGQSSSKQKATTNLNPQAKENNKSSTASTLASLIALRSVNYMTSNVGKWTGNSRNQQTVNNVKQLMGYGMAFAVNPILGLVSVAFDGVTTALDYSYENKWNQIKTEQAKVRTGGTGGYRR